LYRLVAALGDAGAQYNLAVLYSEGKGVAQNYAEAARLYRLAAEQGYANAQCNLGVFHSSGVGVPRDLVEAGRLGRLAAAQGVANAQTLLAILSHERAYVSACCMGCGATRKLKTCSKCNVARFCGAECQRSTWTEHKPHCKRWETEAAV
jgi:TPR repeat protein